MDSASCTSTGAQDPSPRNAPNGHHIQGPPPGKQGNNEHAHPNSGPYPYMYPYSHCHDTSGDSSSCTDNSINPMSIIEHHNNNNMMTNQPHATSSHYTHVDYPFQSGQPQMQSFAPMYTGCGSGIYHNETPNVPDQNAQCNNVVGRQDGLLQPLYGVNPGVAPQMPKTGRSETSHGLNQTRQNNKTVAHQNELTQPLHGASPEAPPPYSILHANPNEARTTAPHQSVLNTVSAPQHFESNRVYQAYTGHPNLTFSAINNSTDSHDPGIWGSYQSMGQNPPAFDYRSGLPQSMNQHLYSFGMGITHCPPMNSTHPNNVEHSPQGVPQGRPNGFQAGAVVPLTTGQPLIAHSGAPAPGPPNVNPGVCEYRAEVNVGSQINHASSNAHAPDSASDTGTVLYPNDSYGGFNGTPTSNVMCSGVQAPNGEDASPPPNPNLPGFQHGQSHNPVHDDVQPISHQNIGHTGGSYGGLHPSANNPGFQNGVAHSPALGFQSHHTSKAAHTGDPQLGPGRNAMTGSNGVTHEIDVKPPPVQCPSSVPVPLTFLNQHAPGYAFDLHFFQNPTLEGLPNANVPIEGAVCAHTYHITMGYPGPGNSRPFMDRINGSEDGHRNGNKLALTQDQNQQHQAKKPNESGLMPRVKDGSNRKTRVQKRRQAGKLHRGGRYEALGSYPTCLQPNGGCGQARMIPEMSPPGRDGAPSGLPPLQPNGLPARQPNGLLALQPNGRPWASTSLHERNGSTPHVNGCNRENKEHIYATKPQGDNIGLHPGPPALGAPVLQEPGLIGVEMPPDAPGVQNHGMEKPQNKSGILCDSDNVLLSSDPAGDLMEGFLTGMADFQEMNTENSKDPLASALLTDSVPFKTPPKDLANRAAAIVQQGQPATVLMGVIQPDTDACFRNELERLDHEIFLGLPSQIRWSVNSNSTYSGAKNTCLGIPPDDGQQQQPSKDGKTAVEKLEDPS
ncbi:hypothetical protein AJ78_02912 [Emergomyces pasteurianus Ep9510]|uniref:Uncharacterized protein n=1 Tax=Emergomyces pasteurianus Ep9510 TaxID=1447872 RepID=A0A1J9PM72_9EURO|nr:hypothetical protein AJ78_02912 [Emergomyces pasteurianus Ep9510]